VPPTGCFGRRPGLQSVSSMLGILYCGTTQALYPRHDIWCPHIARSSQVRAWYGPSGIAIKNYCSRAQPQAQSYPAELPFLKLGIERSLPEPFQTGFETYGKQLLCSLSCWWKTQAGREENILCLQYLSPIFMDCALSFVYVRETEPPCSSSHCSALCQR